MNPGEIRHRGVRVGQTLELTKDGEVRGPPPDPMLGRRLLHYRVIEAIGQGGMSVVYRGRDEHLARDVAIKVLHPFLAEKVECRVRLAREARAVARLEHPNILQVFDFSGDRAGDDKAGVDHDEVLKHGQHEGFIIAELVKGPTLKRYCEKHGLWRVPELGAWVVWQLLEALQHAHDNGIVHRDLKPENVMVREDGTLKLMDFGIAQVADQSGLTVTGTLLGSPAHMAPECIDGLPADERSDLFSMGTVLYWMTTGSLPFEALSPHALLKQIVDGRVVPPQQKSSRVSDDLARVISRSLLTRPADRYASAHEFADALKDVLERSGLSVDDASLRQTLKSPAAEMPLLAARCRSAFMDRASKHLADGQTARALACLNRVLADDPADADARSLLDRLQVDDPVTEGEVDADLAAAADAQRRALSLAASDSPTASTQPMTSLPMSAPFRWQSLLVGVAALAMLSAAIVVARAVDNAVDHAVDAAVDGPAAVAVPTDPAAMAVESGQESSNGAPSSRDDVRDGPDATGIASPVRPGDKPRRLKRTLPGLMAKPVVALATLKPLVTPVTSPPTEETRASRRVTFRVKPWADIVVDGQVMAKSTMAWEADLAEGPHRVLFVNPRAKEHEVRFTVTSDGPPPLITARLEPRPALLVVRASVADAFVDVAGVGKAASDTLSRPLVVALDDQSTSEREVFVYKQGFLAYRKRHTFIAGETLQLDVVLEPESGEAVPPAPAR